MALLRRRTLGTASSSVLVHRLVESLDLPFVEGWADGAPPVVARFHGVPPFVCVFVSPLIGPPHAFLAAWNCGLFGSRSLPRSVEMEMPSPGLALDGGS